MADAPPPELAAAEAEAGEGDDDDDHEEEGDDEAAEVPGDSAQRADSFFAQFRFAGAAPRPATQPKKPPPLPDAEASGGDAESFGGVLRVVRAQRPPRELAGFWAVVAGILSSRTREASVATALARLTRFGLTPERLRESEPAVVEALISNVHFCFRKSQQLVAAAKLVASQWGGRVPADAAQLQLLPGLGPALTRSVLRCIRELDAPPPPPPPPPSP
jgi:hypothetical protein